MERAPEVGVPEETRRLEELSDRDVSGLCCGVRSSRATVTVRLTV